MTFSTTFRFCRMGLPGGTFDGLGTFVGLGVAVVVAEVATLTVGVDNLVGVLIGIFVGIRVGIGV